MRIEGCSCYSLREILGNNPSTILWADQLYISQASFETQIANKEQKEDKIIGMFLEMAEARGIVRKLNMADMYQKTLGGEI